MAYVAEATTVLDTFIRADGDVAAGAGAPIWDTVAWGPGGATNLVVLGNKLASGGGDQSRATLVEMPADMAFAIEADTVGTPGSNPGWFFCLADQGTTDWSGYFMYFDSGAGWTLYKRPTGGPNTEIGYSTILASGGAYTNGDDLEVRRFGTSIQVWRAGADAPFIDIEDGDFQRAGALAVQVPDTTWRFSNLRANAIGGGDTANVLYLDPDNDDADDAHTYVQAHDPATPLSTWARAVELVQTGDEIHIVPPATRSTLGQLHATDQATAATGVTVKSAVEGQRYKIPTLYLQYLTGWVFEDFDTDNGQGGLSTINGCENLTLRNWIAASGGANILNPRGDLLFDVCKWRAPLDGPVASFLDGVGVRFHYAFEGTNGIGNVSFTNCDSSEIQGEDAIQFLGGNHHTGLLLIEGHVFHDMAQSEIPDSPHTDAIQIIGANDATIRGCAFGDDVASHIITSDDQIYGTLTIENNEFAATPGNSVQLFGVNHLVARHNTLVGGGAVCFRIGRDGRPGVDTPTTADIHNNVIALLQIDDESNVTFAANCGNNVIGVGPLTDETDVRGFAEFGSSADTNYELANSPSDSPGIDQAVFVTGDPTVDRRGRTRKGAAPDCGCYESDPAIAIVAGARAPYVITKTPAQGAAAVDPATDVTVVLFPRPGAHLDPGTVIAANAFVTDPGGTHLPVTAVSLSEPDEDNHQTVTLDIAGRLYPYVIYTAHLTSSLADSEGSGLAAPVTWTFRIAGPDGPAVYPAGGPPGGWTVGAI